MTEGDWESELSSFDVRNVERVPHAYINRININYTTDFIAPLMSPEMAQFSLPSDTRIACKHFLLLQINYGRNASGARCAVVTI